MSVQPEFLITEQPVEEVLVLAEVVDAAIAREFNLKRSLSQGSLTHRDEIRQTADFLRQLLKFRETRCADLVRVERSRLEEAGAELDDQVRAERTRWLRRVEQIQTGLDQLLGAFGITAFEPSGLADPNDTDMRGSRPDTGQAPGTIVEVIRPGYRWHGELLRPAQVYIAV